MKPVREVKLNMKFFENATRIYSFTLVGSLSLISWLWVVLFLPVMSLSWFAATAIIAGACCERIVTYLYRHYIQNACIRNVQIQNASV